MERSQGMTCNPKGLPKGPLTNIEDGLEQSVSEQAKERISSLVETIDSLSDVEKLLLYLKLPTGSATEDVLRQTPTSFLYASNRLEQAQAFTWIRSHLEEDSQICVPKHEVFDDYRSYCDSHGLKSLCPADFGKVLKCIFPNVKPRRLGQRGQSRYCYSGLRKKFDIQPPSLPELEISPKKPKTEDLQENELFSASCQLVCEWAGKLLSRGFSSLRELSEFLVGNLYVNSKSTAAFTVLAAMQEAGLHNSRVPVSPLFTCSSGGDKHRETQLQLQRKLQERELLKEQKKKLQQQRSEIEQEQQLRSSSRGPSATPTKSPLPRSFSKTPTPIKSPILRPPSSVALKSPGPVVTFRQTPTLTGALQKPAKCVSRNITKLLQSPVQNERITLPVQDIKCEAMDADSRTSIVSVAAASSAVSTATSTAFSSPSASSSSSASASAASKVLEARKGGLVVGGGDRTSKPTLMVSSVNGMNLLSGGSHQFIISGSQGLILDNEVFAANSETAAIFKNGMHVVQKPVVVSAAGSSSNNSGSSAQQAITTSQLHSLPGSVAGSMTSLCGSVGNLGGSSTHLCGSVGNLGGSSAHLSSSMGNISSSSSSGSSFDSVHHGPSVTVVSQSKDSGNATSKRNSMDMESVSASERGEGGVNFMPGNLSTRSAFVPVSNQKMAFTLVAPNLSAGSVAMSESSSDESKDNTDDLPVPMDQSEALGSSGGFEPLSSDSRGDSGIPPVSMQMSDSSLTLAGQSPQYPGGGQQKKVKNRFTPIRPKAPQAQPPPVGFQKDQKTPEKDSRPVSALLKEKRAREAQEVLQHLASSIQSQASSGKGFPSSLSLPAEVLGLSPDKGASGNDVVIILASPSAGGGTAKVVPRGGGDLHSGDEKLEKFSLRDKPGSVALSMSDILIANPNFVHKKEQASTVPTSQPQVSVSYQPFARHLATEKQNLPGELTTTTTAATASRQVRILSTESDGLEPGNATDEEVTQHMSNTSFSSRLLLPDSRGGADTPTSRKRKSSGQGNANQTHKRRSSAAGEKKNADCGEDDDVFIVDTPTESPPVPRVSAAAGGHHKMLRHVLTDVSAGRVVRRMDAVSPYFRPGSSTFVDMQVDEPVSRCLSTGVGLEELTYTTAGTTLPLAVELSRQAHGKLNVESLESDALLDSGLLPPPPTASSLITKTPYLHHHRLPLQRPAGPKVSCGTSAESLAAMQQALLQEKELLDARFDLFLNKCREQQNLQAAESQRQTQGFSAFQQSTAVKIDSESVVFQQSTAKIDSENVVSGVAYQPSLATATATVYRTSSGHVHPSSHTVHVHPSSQSVQMHLSQPVQVSRAEPCVEVQPNILSVPVHHTATHTVSGLQRKQTEQSAYSDGQTLQTHVNSQSGYFQPTNKSEESSVFNFPCLDSEAGEVGRSDVSVNKTGLLQDASMNVDTFQMDDSLNSFLEIVQGIVSEQSDNNTTSSAAAGAAASDLLLQQKQHQQQVQQQHHHHHQPHQQQQQRHQTQHQQTHKPHKQSRASKPELVVLPSSSTTNSKHSVPSSSAEPSSLQSSGTVPSPSSFSSFSSSSSSSHPVKNGTAAQNKPSPAQRQKGKSASSQQPPPNTLLALLQSPVLSAISPPSSSSSASSVKKVPEKSHAPVSSQAETGQTRRSSHHRSRNSSGTVATSAVTQTSVAGSPPQPTVVSAFSNQQTQPRVSLMSGGSVRLAGESGNSFNSLVSRIDSGALRILDSGGASVRNSTKILSRIDGSSSFVGDIGVGVSVTGRRSRRSGGDSILPDSTTTTSTTTTTTLGPVPPSLPANFLDAELDFGSELPLDVANFVTDYSLKADLEKQEFHTHHQQVHHSVVQQPGGGEGMPLDKELQNFLLQNNPALLAGCVPGMDGRELAAALSGAQEQKDTFSVPCNPAPKQRLSESGSTGAKKFPPVQRSASLPVFNPRGLPVAVLNAPGPDIPPSPTPSPTKDLAPNNVSVVPARRVRQTAGGNSTPSDAGYHSFDASPLMPSYHPLAPPPVSTPTPQEHVTMGLASLRKIPLLSVRSDSAQSVSSEGVLSLPQGSPQTSQGVLSNPGSVSACSPEDSNVASPSAFMPIQVSPSSSLSSVVSGRSSLQHSYIPPIRPLVTVASVGVGSDDPRNMNTALVSTALSSGGMVSTRTLGLLTSTIDNSFDLQRLSQIGLGVVTSSDFSQGMSPMETSPGSSVPSVKSDPGTTSSVSRLMSASPCPGTVPYNVPSPRRQPASGVSPGPSPTPATSSACSPSPSAVGHRASAGHGVLQKLLSTRSAPPSYAESVQQRLMAGSVVAQMAGNQVIGGFVDQRQPSTVQPGSGSGSSHGAVRGRTSTNSAQARISSGSMHAGTSTELTGQFTIPMMSAEDVKPSVRSMVHHSPSTTSTATTTTTAAIPTATASTGERSGRRIAILKRDSNAKPRTSSSSNSSSSSSSGQKAACETILKASLASPPSPMDATEYSRPFSQKLLFLKQQISQSEVEVAMATGKGTQAKRHQQQAAGAAPASASAVLAASLATLKQGSNPAETLSAVPPSPGSKTGGGSLSNLAVQVSSPATPGSVSSAPSPASQGQGQMSVPLRISTSAPSHPSSSDIFFGLPASSPSPSPRGGMANPFSPQQPPSSSSSTASSTSTSSQGALYLPFNLPDMNYMGNAPNIDLSQLLPGSKTPTTAATTSTSSTAGPSRDSSELQGLDELHLTLDILRGMDGQYFTGQEGEGEDLMHNVFGELTQELQATAADHSQDEEEEDDEDGGAPSRSRVRQSSGSSSLYDYKTESQSSV